MKLKQDSILNVEEFVFCFEGREEYLKRFIQRKDMVRVVCQEDFLCQGGASLIMLEIALGKICQVIIVVVGAREKYGF